jgi:hypothetical protein
LATHRIKVGISLDGGPGATDRHRSYPSGRGTYAAVATPLAKILIPAKPVQVYASTLIGLAILNLLCGASDDRPLTRRNVGLLALEFYARRFVFHVLSKTKLSRGFPSLGFRAKLARNIDVRIQVNGVVKGICHGQTSFLQAKLWLLAQPWPKPETTKPESFC